MSDLSIFIVGAAGEGIQTIGDVMSRALMRQGIRVFATSEFESRIRGGNSSFRLRIGGINAPRQDADILLALNPNAAAFYAQAARADCLMLGEVPPGGEGIEIPFRALAKEQFGSPLFANSLAVGALGALLGLPSIALEDTLRAAFGTRGEDVLKSNLEALHLGQDKAREAGFAESTFALQSSDETLSVASVHEVIPIAAAAASCRIMVAYPMSPSTGIITAFAKKPELGVFVEQAEDEIAAINMALGASAAGARAMTATSGGGYALMTEAVSLSGMTETPLVIVLAQRPGPATGLPTRTAQEDLLFALHGGHGEFARAILAPSDPQDAIEATFRAFWLADNYQIPVIVLTDQYLADSRFCMPELAIPSETVPLGLSDPEAHEDYQRYQLTEDGISPRLALGQSEHLVRIDSDEHTEAGHITEDLEHMRPAMVEKRLEKLRRLKQEMILPDAYQTEDAETILISWGSTRHAVREAVDRLTQEGQRVGSLHFTDLWPLPQLRLPDTVAYWVVEGNATGQFAGVLEQVLGLQIQGRIGRYDGLPIDADTVLEALT